MRKLLFLVVAAGVLGLVALLWNATFTDDAGHQRQAATHAEDDAGARDAPAKGELTVEKGVARAPDFDDLKAGSSRRVWYGRAIDGASDGVAGAHIVVEEIEGERVWAQPPTREGGFFIAIVEEDLQAPVRIVVTTSSAVGMKVARLDPEEAVHVGNIRLRGGHPLAGRTLLSRDRPAADVRLTLRQFGELRLTNAAVAATTSDEEGFFEFKQVPAGMFALEGTGPAGHRFLRVPVVVPREGVTLFAMRASDFSFVVRNTLNEPVPEALVRVKPVGPPADKEPLGRAAIMQALTAVTDARGHGVIQQLPPGVYAVDVVVKSAVFEFRHQHHFIPRQPMRPRVFRVATDLTLALLFIAAPARSRPTIEVPLRETSVTLDLVGGDVETTMRVRTDRDGVVYVPRLAATTLRVGAKATKVHREGVAFLSSVSLIHEGPFPSTILMRPYNPLGKEQPKRKKRTGRVVTPGGLPVKDAMLYLYWSGKGRPKRKTNSKGVAEVGEAPDEAAMRLFRPDLASGDPESPALGGKELVEFVWKRGRKLRVEVRDARHGFPLSGGVRIWPRPKAWTRVGPGAFTSHWDDDADVGIEVDVSGYDTFKTTVGAASEYTAEMVPAGADLERLRIEVMTNNKPRPGVWVSGYTLVIGPASNRQEGRTAFTALTGAGGRVDVANLKPGAWVIQVDAGPAGGKRYELYLARGANPLTLQCDLDHSVRGRISTRRGRRLANVLVLPNANGLNMLAVRTDRRGNFVLNFPGLDGQTYGFKASLSGYTSKSFDVVAKKNPKPVTVVLTPQAGVDMRLMWADQRSRPIPDDIEMRIHALPKDRTRYEFVGTARVVSGRLRALNLPAGRKLAFSHLRGGAWIKRFIVELQPGQILRHGVSVHSGGVVEGTVVRGGKAAANVVVFLKRRYRVSRPARTNAKGEFSVRGLVDGTYAVHVRGQTEASRKTNERLLVKSRRVTTGVIVELRAR